MTPTASRVGGTGSAADFLPPRRTIPALRRAAEGCRGCHLWTVGTQTVCGEGGRTPSIMFVGEQPGDQEDRAGQPFVGPSGKLLDGALERAGLDRDDAYVTNAVKHFKWVPDPRGKRRIHKTPNAGEVRACHPWLDAEIAAVKPRVIAALGATAACSATSGRSSAAAAVPRPMAAACWAASWAGIRARCSTACSRRAALAPTRRASSSSCSPRSSWAPWQSEPRTTGRRMKTRTS